MTEKAFREMLITNEPVFEFRNIEYQICFVGHFLAGPVDDDSQDQSFDNIDDLMNNLKLNGVPIREALLELKMN